MNRPSEPTLRSQALLQELGRLIEQWPFGHDLFRVLRAVDALQAQCGRPRLGTAPTPRQEYIRVGQPPALAFAASSVQGAQWQDEVLHLQVQGFGLWGPNGPLPLHMTEYFFQRSRNFNDHAGVAFLDQFHHRLFLLFFRAWSQAQAVCDLEHDQDGFTRWLASLAGTGPVGQQASLPAHAVCFQAPVMVAQAKSAHALQTLLSSHFQLPVTIQENVPVWVTLDEQVQASLGGVCGRLGQDTVLGARVLDVQQTIRIRIGPLGREDYEHFLPGRTGWWQLRSWLALYLGMEWSVQLQLVLRACDQPGLQLGAGLGLGLQTWVGAGGPQDKADLCLFLDSRPCQPPLPPD
ncbi:MAG TPA: type VI secretion system baseplate subunit TssG [Alcaligenes sp.]|nr:type VI secretion system baseplate subunit TssG [Alcaligenes sp.]HRL26088.1 type VI secretion system baseplate subunit TssG [Alcaligenes sp.]